jgi:hypothetical protein
MEINVERARKVPSLMLFPSVVVVEQVEADVANDEVGIRTREASGELVDTDEGHVETVVATLGE